MPTKTNNNSTFLIPNFSLAKPFTFSAKEKDSETGLSYFGSRYYNSDLSIWLSVDPMASKYPSLSPFTYCANNPIKLVDPNGEEVIKNTYKWEFNQTTGKISYVGDVGGKFHQTVMMTKNMDDTNFYGHFRLEFWREFSLTFHSANLIFFPFNLLSKFWGVLNH